MRFCSSCGKPLSLQASYCPACGAACGQAPLSAVVSGVIAPVGVLLTDAVIQGALSRHQQTQSVRMGVRPFGFLGIFGLVWASVLPAALVSTVLVGWLGTVLAVLLFLLGTGYLCKVDDRWTAERQRRLAGGSPSSVSWRR